MSRHLDPVELREADVKLRADVEHVIPYARQLAANLIAKRNGDVDGEDLGTLADYYEDLSIALRYVADEILATPRAKVLPGAPCDGGSSCA